MTTAENRDTALEFLRRVGAGDLSGAFGLCTDEAIFWNPGSGTLGKAEFGALVSGAMALFEGEAQLEILGTIAEGGAVAVEARSFARLKRGGTYANKYCFVVRFEGGKIASVSEYADTAPVAAALKPQ